MLLHHLLRSPSNLKTLTLNLIIPFSTKRYSKSKSISNSKSSSESPPPVSEAELNQALSTLPTRFTTSDVTHLISITPNPVLVYHLFNHAAQFPRFRPDPNLFLITIKKLGSARLYTLLHPIASLALSTLPPSQPLFNTIIYFFTQARFITKAIYVYKVMRDSEDEKCKPNIQTYNLLFNALLGRGASSYIHHLYMDTVRMLFRQMVEGGVKPDLMALNFVVKGYSNSLHLNDALRVFHQYEPVYGVEPDENTYGYLVHGLCAQGRTKNAMELYEEMKGKGMRAGFRAGNSLICALAMGGETEKSVRIMWEVVGMRRRVELMSVRTVVENMVREGRRMEQVMEFVMELVEKEVVDRRMVRELMNWVEGGCGVWLGEV